ncbi:MAG: hypothetical protein ABIW84_02960 [Ilumatobacteraceae bacterium]
MTDVQPDLEIRLERVISAPHDARFAVRRLLADAAEDEFWQNALLATSEIVTHVLTNASGECSLSAWYSDSPGWLRVEVAGGGGEMPDTNTGSAHPEMGGLRLAVLLEVPAVWGMEHTPFGRIVWFEVHRTAPESFGPESFGPESFGRP